MKKNKVIGLSLLAFSAVAVLASCGGAKTPTQQPDVYFRAKSQIIVDTATGATKSTEYEDEECATIEVKDKDNLKYGEQDVEITIKPTKFFTFKAYDDDWAPVGAALKPYVGLGNPHSLYNYPLQENVAWTFEDKTTSEGEEYLVTVKKEFFKKNIVIDYGNVNANTAVYAYTSNFYNKLFTENLEFVSDFNNKNTYAMDLNHSAFEAPGDGAIITYTFKNEVTPYTFSGWDALEPELGQNDKYRYYDHFQIYGINETTGDTGENIARYENDVEPEKQKFKVVTDDSHISFFIDWSLLAKNDKDYTPIYNKIRMSFDEPTLAYIYSTEKDDNITVYPCDFFQHPNQSERIPFTTDGEVNTYDEQTDTPLPFKNVFVNGKNLPDGEQVLFSSIFQLNHPTPGNNQWFSVSIHGHTFNIDLDKGMVNYTTWHNDSGQDGETELKYWQIKDNTNKVLWNLVQLNPTDRTYGLPAALQGGNNLYYLYTTNANALTEAAASYGREFKTVIHFESQPSYTPFVLNDDGSRTYGVLNSSGTGDPYSYEYACVGLSQVDIRFYPGSVYTSLVFSVTLSDYSSDDYTATYTPGSDYATIHITLNNGLFEEGAPVKISLALADTYAYLVGETSNLGGFVTSAEDTETTTTCTPTIEDNTAHCLFKFSSGYEYLSEPENFNLFKQVYSYNGGKQLEVQITRVEGGHPVIEIMFIADEEIQSQGFSFAVQFIYMNVGVNAEALEAQGIYLNYQTDFNAYVGRATTEPLIVNIEVISGAAIFEKIYSTVGIAIQSNLTIDENYQPRIDPSKKKPGGYELTFKYSEDSNYITNGTKTTITLS